jgi:hypothetical protein
MLLVLRSRGTPHSPIRRLLAGRDRSLRRGNPRGLAGPAGRTRNLRRGLSGRHRGLLVVVGMTTAGRPPQRSGAVWRWPSAQACLCWSKCAWRALQAVRGSPGLQAEAPPLWGAPHKRNRRPSAPPRLSGVPATAIARTPTQPPQAGTQTALRRPSASLRPSTRRLLFDGPPIPDLPGPGPWLLGAGDSQPRDRRQQDLLLPHLRGERWGPDLTPALCGGLLAVRRRGHIRHQLRRVLQRRDCFGRCDPLLLF